MQNNGNVVMSGHFSCVCLLAKCIFLESVDLRFGLFQLVGDFANMQPQTRTENRKPHIIPHP